MTTNETTSTNQKTVLRKRLEEIETEIYISWLRDQDKIKELIELCGILDQIHSQSSIEDFFENEGDFEYFCKKFSNQTIQNILKQHYIYGTNGDEIALNVLFAYLRIFLKFMEKPQYQILWDSVKEIFDFSSHYYKGVPLGTNKNYNEKKLMSAEKYNENLLSKKIENKLEIILGMELDVFIENRKSSSFYNSDKKIWVRGKVNRLENEYFLVAVGEAYGNVVMKYNSFEYAKKGAMTKDWEWRYSLDKNDNIDCLDRGRWFPATVLSKRVEEQNGLEKVDYRVAFRLYPHLINNWEEYKKFWSNRDLNRDSLGEYYGDPENIDEWIPAISKRIQKFNSHIHSGDVQDSIETENYFIDDLVKFNDGNKKNYIIGRSNGFSYYYATTLSYFCNMNGFQKMTLLLGKKGEERPASELISNIFSILNYSFSFFHKDFVILLGKNLHENIFSYLNDMTSNELRNMKKETFDLIVKVLKVYLGLTIGIDERNELIEKFSINFAIKMIKTTFLEKRITAVKTIVDVIKSCKNNPDKKKMVLRFIEENQIFYEIYGPNSHIQLINKSKDLLEIMLQENKLSDGEMEMIWAATNKGDLEGKLTILKTLKEISHSMQPKHINVLLENIYSNKSNDLLNDEIDLIYELSTHNSQSEENLEKCIKFFTGSLLESKIDEGEKIEILINKIYEITKHNPSFKSSVIKMTLDSLDKNDNVNLALKILQKYLKESDLSSDYDLNLLLIENDSLVNLFCNSFMRYLSNIREKSKNWTQDIDLLPLRDNFTHSQNIKARLQFLSALLSIKLWRIKEDPIEFVYGCLIEQGLISLKDKNEFFNWIKISIENNVDYKTEEKIFDLFNTKICKDTKSCQNLSIEAFDTYLRVFLDINSQNLNLKYHKIPRENKYELDVFIEPEQLIGFEILWKIVFDSYSVDIMNKGIETLHSIFTNVQIRKGENLHESNDENISYSQMLLKKCINLINQTNNNSSYSLEEKKNKITKCLFVLKLTIEESEKRGTAGIKSHSGILKKRIIQINISTSIGNFENREFTLRIYANTTIWELKELIATRLKFSHDFLKILISKTEYELKITDNGKTAIDFNLQNGDEIKCSSNGMDKLIPQAEFISEGKHVPEIVQIFNDWFETFSSEGKMSKEGCSKFIQSVTGSREDVSSEDSRIQFLFNTYDRNKDDFLERDEFTEFYLECCFKPDRRKVVWENLKSMGIRNDLKKMSEPYQTYVEDKTTLPRYQLAHNEEFFNSIFNLQDLNDEIAKEAFNYLCLICTNPRIYNQNLNVDQNTNWKTLLDETNIYKLIYSLQIIESFIEDIEINDENVDCLGADGNNNLKLDWMKNFVEKGGYIHLIQILEKRLNHNVQMLRNREPISNQLMNNICVEFLIKIVKIFYFSSLNKYDAYKKTVSSLTRRISNLSLGDTTKSSLPNLNSKLRKKSFSLKKSNSNQYDGNALDTYFIESGLGDFILKSFDHESLVENLIHLISNLVAKNNRTKEESYIIDTSFEFVSVIIPFSTNYEKVEKIIVSHKFFITNSLYGLLNENNSVRVLFSNSLIKLCKLLENFDRFGLISYMFSGIFDLIENISEDLERNSNELFEFFSYLLEIYLNEPNKFGLSNFGIEINPKKFLKKLLDILESDINGSDQGNSSNEVEVSLSDELFIGYLKIVTKVAENNLEIKNEISNNYNLIQGVLTKVLFKQNSGELFHRLSKLKFIDPDKINDNKSNRNSNQKIRNACYDFVLSLLKNSIENFEKFFTINVLETEENKKEDRNEKSKYYICNNSKNEGHVGLRNLHFICYMNSMMQQFFMVPALRYNILNVDDQVQPDTDNYLGIDDNTLHQVQRMFSFLEMSDRMDYNPPGFCYSFKDWEGNPTNVGVQQDAQEFLTRFLDVIENQLRTSDKKYILQSIFGGKTCSQFTCEQGCGTVTNRFEDFYTLSLEVNNMKTLHDSFDKLITPEKIDEVNCETCKKKVTKTKRTLLGSLPNVLIVHLQRLSYNYEIDRNEKINSRLEFPKVLNLKEYCIEEVTRQASVKKNKDSEEETIDFETDEIYYKHPTYYEYHLVGVVIHSGSADSGHYYSYINSVRGGSDNEAFFNPKDEAHLNAWLEFNDSHVSKFNIANLESECYGGSYEMKEWGTSKGERTRSAYMLVYERRIKSPIRIVVEPTEDSSRLVSIKEDELARTKKEYDLSRFYDTPEYNQVKEKLYNSVFYDVSRNEYTSYAPYYNKERLIPKQYYLELTEDNSLLQKHQNISDERFVSFFDNVILFLDETMSNIKEIKLESSGKISITFMNFIFNILSQKDKQELLKTAKDKFLHILESQPICLRPVWEYLHEHQKQLNELLINDSEILSTEYCDLVYELVKMVYKFSPDNFTNEFNNTYYQDDDEMLLFVRKIIDGVLSLFPRVPTKLISKTGPVLKLIGDLSRLDHVLLRYFSSKEAIFIFITFFLGRDSPCYEDTLIKKGDNWDYGRNNIAGFEHMVEIISEIYLHSSSNRRRANSDNDLKISQRDIECIKNLNFLKFIFKNCDKVFSSLLVNLSYEDEEFTIQSCQEITRYIDDIYTYNGQDFIRLFNSTLPLLDLKDSLQRMRFEIILGIPQCQVEEINGRNTMPLIGYHNLSDDKCKYFDYKGTINLRNMCCVLKKLFLIKSKDTVAIQIFLSILEACTYNMALLKYIRRLKAEEPLFDDFIEWGVALINSHGKNDSNIYYVKMKQYVGMINPILDKVMSDPLVLPGFRGFMGKYLLKDIKREEISLIAHKDSIYLFELEYHGNYIKLDEQIDYSQSKSYVSGGSMNLLGEDDEKISKESLDKVIDDSENLSDIPTDVQLFSADFKLGMNEKEFLNKVLVNLTMYKKVIVENKYSVPETTSLIKRYVILNDSNRDVNFDFKIKRFTTPAHEEINEYIPSGHISAFIPSKVARTVYLLTKINPEKEWEAGANWDYSLDYENIAYRNSGGNYNGVTNAPIYLNYTNYANYSEKNNSAASAGYPNMNSYGYPETNKIPEEDDDIDNLL